MDTLVQGCCLSSRNFEFNRHANLLPMDQIRPDSHESGRVYVEYPVSLEGLDTIDKSPPHSEEKSPSESENSEEGDYSDAILKYISQMLMEEEGLVNKPCMFHESLALQATEKSFYDVLHKPNSNPLFSSDGNSNSPSSEVDSYNHSSGVSSVESAWVYDLGDFRSSLMQSITPLNYQAAGNSSAAFSRAVHGLDGSSLDGFHVPFSSREEGISRFLPNVEEENGPNYSPNGSRGKKNHDREEDSDSGDDSRSNKQMAGYDTDPEPLELFDNVLLCPNLIKGSQEICCPEDSLQDGGKGKSSKNETSKGSNRGRPRGNKKQGGTIREVVDLRSLLMQCAQAVASYNNRTAEVLLKQIRQHSSPRGDGTERLSHYFANALEARMAGTGTELYTAFRRRKISAADLLKAYQLYVTSCPFKRVSNMYANRWIKKLAIGAKSLHIIDFGILYGFQWPCLIQILAATGAPPKLRVTGIDLPQPGFRPAERVEETGERLAKYCRRFNVEFEYQAIAKKWETIQLEDLNIDKDEVTVVNCLYRLGNVPDESVAVDSPRDVVLNLIKRIRPNVFIHGVTNGTYNTPFFVTRFREALFHFSSQFDMCDATMPLEDQNRMLFESEYLGRDAMNVIACEGTERVERPETYKQWQVRNRRAGFRQVGLDHEIVNCVKNKVRKCYHKDFSVDEDGNWMLHGWKGRVSYALSCWKPTQD